MSALSSSCVGLVGIFCQLFDYYRGIGQHHPPDTSGGFWDAPPYILPRPTFGATQTKTMSVSHIYSATCRRCLRRSSGLEPSCADHNNAMHLYTTNLSPSLRAVPHTPKAYSPRPYRVVLVVTSWLGEPTLCIAKFTSCGREGSRTPLMLHAVRMQRFTGCTRCVPDNKKGFAHRTDAFRYVLSVHSCRLSPDRRQVEKLLTQIMMNYR